MSATDDQYIAKKKWGCTCEKCHGGWLSPRTLIRLQDAADIGGDTVLDSIDFIIPREPMETIFIDFHPFLSYIPLQLWREMFKTFISGYSVLFRVARLLLSRYVLPSESVVLAEAEDRFDYFETNALKFYFNKGGRVEYALAAMVDYSQEDPFETYADDERFTKITPCVNDREFDIVKKNIGLDPKKSWGPYSASPEPPRSLWMHDER
ncbi:hypothetical protein C8R46DRAFT_1209278 [Mycena filopes]|nr:hypothetical protein C8R46DRAFT_1209278 [Mycena filopes]